MMLRPEPETVAHDWDTGVKDLCLPGPRTCFASVFAKLSGRAGGQLFPKALHNFGPRRASLSSTISGGALAMGAHAIDQTLSVRLWSS